MKIAMVAAEFSPEEANGLRRAMATFRHNGGMSHFKQKMVEKMVERGYERAFAENCFKQIEGFGSYGFPESHAASFALLVYVSSWIKCHHPAVFAAALLNSQPMGFYAPAQIVRDAREHGVEVRDADANASDWDCTLEAGAVRLGLRMISGFQEGWWATIRDGRGGGFGDLAGLVAAGVPRPALEHLAGADALRSIGLGRRLGLWRVAGLDVAAPAPLVGARRFTTPALPLMSDGEQVIADYRTTGLSLRAHPCALLREKLAAAKVVSCAAAMAARNGAVLRTGGVVTVRQRPGTAKGTIFITIEDETGIANVVVWPALVEVFRNQILGAALLIVQGQVQRGEEGVTHLIARELVDRTRWIGALDAPLARADEMPRRRPWGHPRQERVVRKSRDFH